MTAFDNLTRKLTALPQRATEQLTNGVQRAADRTNAQFRASSVPVRAVVIAKTDSVQVQLQQTGPLTRKFGGKTPLQLLKDNLASELRDAAHEIEVTGLK